MTPKTAAIALGIVIALIYINMLVVVSGIFQALGIH